MEATEKVQGVQFEVGVSVAAQTIEDELCSALEGGSNYWYEIVATTPSLDRSQYLHEVPVRGGSLTFATLEHDEIGGAKTWVLDRAAIERGLVVIATKYPKHFADMLTENGDATTGDVLLQCCLFGELVFG